MSVAERVIEFEGSGCRGLGFGVAVRVAFGNTSGAIASAVTGFILDRTGHFFWAFAVASAFCVLGVFSWIFLVCPVEPVVWTRRSPVDFGKADVELV